MLVMVSDMNTQRPEAFLLAVQLYACMQIP